MDAIDQMFAEFELVFHNQYQKAFSSREKEDWAKRLWYNNFKEFSPQQILDAAHRAIQASEYLPTVHGVLKYIEKPTILFSSLPPLQDHLSREEKLAALAKLRKDTGL
jgi:hypothetical protein